MLSDAWNKVRSIKCEVEWPHIIVMPYVDDFYQIDAWVHNSGIIKDAYSAHVYYYNRKWYHIMCFKEADHYNLFKLTWQDVF